MDPVYLDHAAATPLRPEVREAMEPLRAGLVGNASSVHRWGRLARATLEGARERCAVLLGVRPDELHFTRGGTEANNLAILGRAAWARASGHPTPGFARSAVEHSAVREPLESLAAQGCRVDILSVRPDATLSLPPREALTDGVLSLVSVQWVNQETGMVLPVAHVAERCREAGIPLHVDAAQAAGRVGMDLQRVPVSLLSLSGHKLGGPRSTGLLAVRRDTEIRPVLFGGGQEGGLRPGTEDVAGAVGFAVALEVAVGQLETEAARLTALRDRLEEGLVENIPGIRVHGKDAPRAPHILGVGVPGLFRDVLPAALDLEGVGASAGSACRSGSTEVSPVLAALYGADAAGFAPLRLSLGWTTTERDIEAATPRIVEVVARMAEVGGRA
ncbi:MAG: cysteine desulfurase family protein [Gemmatimonadota bacterium]